MVRSTRTHICFRVPRKVKEILEIIADYRGVDLSNLFQAYAISLAIQFDPRIVRDKDVQKFVEEVFGSDEDSVLQTNP